MNKTCKEKTDSSVSDTGDASAFDLKMSEEIFRLMIQNSNDSFVLMDAKGNQIYLNEAGADVTGFSKEELLGSFEKVIHPDDLEKVRDAYIKVCSGKEVVKVQYRHIHKSKTYIWMEAVGQNHLENPAINAIVLNVRDITEIKDNEALISNQNEELQKLNRQKDELIIAEAEKSRKLKVLLEKRKKELAVNALMLTHVNNMQRYLLKELSSVSESEEVTANVKKLVSEISVSIRNIDWGGFQRRFEELQLGFFKKLGKRFPKLSPAEQKLVAYIKLGFSSKEISALTHNTLESVHVSRSRLRKKLGLSIADNLALFINKI
ncbi:MAG: hypothetical protein CVU11_09280 [Bacteroidetes bacterium HGW-Bacteroidetes-6]|jgi:PAS domain S-box-containing protein|nr:MAG: hypothetical protein CVU11_09280 [Bacteroidetes bacterium HGW-Bacteroidetes-6]